MFDAGPWELATLLSKLVAYAGFVSFSGGLFVFWLGTRPEQSSAVSAAARWSPAARAHLVSRTILKAAAALAALVLYFLLQIGLINQNGLRGMFDSFMAGIVLQSTVGYGVIMRTVGILLPLTGLLMARRALLATGSARIAPRLQVSWLVGTLLFSSSFAVLGHVVNLSLLAQLAIVLHTFAISLWVGALYPLYVLCEREPAAVVLPVLRRFGVWGWGITASLLVTGVFLLTQLVEAPADMLTTPYGQLLSAKLVLVLALLGLGALNKFRLVPALEAAGAGKLSKSIAGERALVVLILVLTACMTTLTGPSHMN
jgi:putative copper resistance protein D